MNIAANPSSLKSIASRYLKLLDARVTSSTIQLDIEENPYYPSLLSLTDTFSKYKIENIAYKIRTEDIGQMEPPFVALVILPKIGRDFILVTEITDRFVRYFHGKRKPNLVSKEEFAQRFQGIVWEAETTEQSGDEQFERKMKEEKSRRIFQRIWILGCTMTILTMMWISFDPHYRVSFGLISVLKLAGLSLTALLLAYETDKGIAFVKNICSSNGRINCDAVLNSKAATIMGISWSEIGFFYFASTFIWLLLPVTAFANKIPSLAIANILAVPYVFFSFYWQWRVVKQWCVLCLVIQGILVGELAWSLFYYWRFPFLPVWGLDSIPGIAFSILLPMTAWYGIKRVLVKAKNHDLYRAAYKRVQNNREIFFSILKQQPKAPDGWVEMGIEIGNPAATHTIIKVCNPFCSACSTAHFTLERLVMENPNVKLKIFFAVREDRQEKGAAVVKHLLTLADRKDQAKTMHALNDWYGADRKDYHIFAGKHPVNGKSPAIGENMAAMQKWCEEAEITHTPTLFINGHLLPDNYEIGDLKHIL